MEQNAKKKIPCGGFMLGEGLVLSEDGKTLNVSGGGGSGSGQFIVTVYATDAQGTKFAADKTYDEIKAAIDSGAMVLVHYKSRKNATDYKVFYNTSVSINDGYKFDCFSPEGDGYIYFYTIYIYEENGEMVISRDKCRVQFVAGA